MHVITMCLLLTHSIAKQVTLNSRDAGTYVKGAKVQILSPTTVDIGNNKFNIIVNSDSDEWALWINMDNTWGYDTTLASRFTMTLPGNTISDTDCDMLLSFTDGLESPSSKYFTMIVRLDGNGFNMIAPGCDSNLLNPTRNLLSGDVYWVMAPGPSQAPGTRACRPAYINTSHPCDYDDMGTASDATSWPLTFIIENYPAQNRMTVTFEGNGYAATSCAFNEHIPVNTGHNIYITGQSVDDNYEITQIFLKYELLSPATTPTTSLPTTSSPTTKQPATNNPTTATPTTLNPTFSPTFNPTTSPTTSNPTTTEPSIHPTHNPTVSPTTYAPTTFSPTTYAPTWVPTVTPTINVPTSRPTNEGEHVEYTTMENTDNNELSVSVMSTTAILMIIIIILLALILLCCIVVCAKKLRSYLLLRDKYAKDAESECIDSASNSPISEKHIIAQYSNIDFANKMIDKNGEFDHRISVNARPEGGSYASLQNMRKNKPVALIVSDNEDDCDVMDGFQETQIMALQETPKRSKIRGSKGTPDGLPKPPPRFTSPQKLNINKVPVPVPEIELNAVKKAREMEQNGDGKDEDYDDEALMSEDGKYYNGDLLISGDNDGVTIGDIEKKLNEEDYEGQSVKNANNVHVAIKEDEEIEFNVNNMNDKINEYKNKKPGKKRSGSESYHSYVISGSESETRK